MTEHQVPSKLYITEEERARLVAQSSSRLPLAVTFAGDKISLDYIGVNAWAFALLAEWRGLNA